MTLDTTSMTPEEIENRNTLIQAKSGAIKTFTKEYEKHHHVTNNEWRRKHNKDITREFSASNGNNKWIGCYN